MLRGKRLTTGAAMVLALAVLASGEVRKEFHYKVHHRASVSIFNQYGPISVKPIGGHQVVVTAVLHSDKVEVDQNPGRKPRFSDLSPAGRS